MKSRIFRVMCIGLLFVGALAACSGDVYERAYTASGDGNRERDLNQTEQFLGNDDLNVVIKLSRRGDPVIINTRFIDPNGDVLEEITAEADSDIGTVVMGVDYEARQDIPNEWLSGRYRVEVRVDGELVDTLFFRVD
ncbi:MAG: hypothetical protein ACLFTK_07765 [Anaerolineales bacterium]